MGMRWRSWVKLSQFRLSEPCSGLRWRIRDGWRHVAGGERHGAAEDLVNGGVGLSWTTAFEIGGSPGVEDEYVVDPQTNAI